MANEVERTIAVITALVDDTPSTELLLRVVNRFASHWQSEFNAIVGVDENGEPNEPTNQQLAGFFLLKMRDFGKDILRAEGKRELAATMTTDITAAGDTAAGDM